MAEEENVVTPEPETPGVQEEASVEVHADAASAADASEPDAEAVLTDRVGSLEAQLAEANKKVAEYLDGWQRSQAAFTNYRKRTEAEQVSWRSVANAALLSRLLPVADDFSRAFQALPVEFKGHPWLEGITLIQRKVASILESENVKPIEVEPGDTFDPLYHQAIFYQELEGFEEGQIIAEVERGYILGERVLRPSSVVVAKAPAKVPEPIIETADEVIEAEGAESGENDVADAACCDDADCCCSCDES